MTVEDRARKAWMASEQRLGTMSRVRRQAYTAGYIDAMLEMGIVVQVINEDTLINVSSEGTHVHTCIFNDKIRHLPGQFIGCRCSCGAKWDPGYRGWVVEVKHLG